MTKIFGEPHQVAGEQNTGTVWAWKALPTDVGLSTLGPEEINGADGPTWDERYPPVNEIGKIDYATIRDVSGRCQDGLVWKGGWYGQNGSENFEDIVSGHATVADCGGGFGPVSIDCKPGNRELMWRFAYADHQQPNSNGLVALDLDRNLSVFYGRNGDVYRHEQVYVTLELGHPLLEALKGGSVLNLVGDCPNQAIHLSGSRIAI